MTSLSLTHCVEFLRSCFTGTVHSVAKVVDLADKKSGALVVVDGERSFVLFDVVSRHIKYFDVLHVTLCSLNIQPRLGMNLVI